MVTPAGNSVRAGATSAVGGVSDAVAASPAGQAIGFNQTAFIFGVVAVAFLIYVTIKGDLPKWLGLLGLAPSSPSSSSGLSSPGTGQSASAFTATPNSQTGGTNTAGAALPDVLSGNYGSGNVIPFPALPNLSASAGLGSNY